MKPSLGFRTVWISALFLAVFAAGFYATSVGLVGAPDISIKWENPNKFSYQPSYRTESGAELVLIYIGSSGCVYSNKPDLPDKIDQLKSLVQSKATESGRGFATIGISRDWDVERGLAHLAKFGEFDEVMTGRSWANEGIMKYVWESSYGEPATPQVIIIDRFLSTDNSAGSHFKMLNEEFVLRKVGPEAIQDWLDLNAPLPKLSSELGGSSGI